MQRLDKILIIDDNYDLAEYRKEYIQKALPQAEIFIGENPKWALLHKNIDVIFCDVSSLTDVKHPRIETLDYSILLKFRKSILVLYSGVNSWASSIVDEIKREYPKQIAYFMPNDIDLIESFIERHLKGLGNGGRHSPQV
jgi:hypothetical protein